MDLTTPSIMYFVEFSSKTVFFKLQDVFPECFLYRDGYPRIESLICMREENSCHVGKNCMETLLRRLQVLFKEVATRADLAVLYYKKIDNTGMGAGVFYSNLSDFRIITVNPFAWNRIKNRGNVYQFTPDTSFFLTGKAPVPEQIKELPEKKF